MQEEAQGDQYLGRKEKQEKTTFAGLTKELQDKLRRKGDLEAQLAQLEQQGDEAEDESNEEPAAVEAQTAVEETAAGGEKGAAAKAKQLKKKLKEIYALEAKMQANKTKFEDMPKEAQEKLRRKDDLKKQVVELELKATTES